MAACRGRSSALLGVTVEMAQTAPTATRRWRLLEVALGIWAILFFFLPVVLCMAFWLGTTGFVPLPRLRPIAELVSLAVAAVYAVALGPQFYRLAKPAWLSGRYKDTLANAAMVVFSPFFGWCIVQGFFAGPVSYAFHRLNASIPAEVQLTVVAADDTGGRRSGRCRKKALLNHERFFWRQAVCGIDDRTVDKLRNGGQLKVLATFSDYGILVTRHAGEP
jgi:hypothetical protein